MLERTNVFHPHESTASLSKSAKASQEDFIFKQVLFMLSYALNILKTTAWKGSFDLF